MLDPRIKNYLNLRGISDEVLERRKIDFKNGRIVIPIQDKAGNTLFRKYRKDPEDKDQTNKYQYDTGAKATLYRVDVIPQFETIVICEGELDSLCLESRSIPSVTGTGGCKTFLPEWADILKGKTIYICMDNDRAGIEASIKINEMLPDALVIEIPKKKGIKDVTDFFLQHTIEDWNNLKRNAVSYYVPVDKVSEELYKWTIAKREALNKDQDGVKEQIFIDYLAKREEQMEKPKIKKGGGVTGNSKLQKAKSVPITDIVKFNRRGFALCVFHQEKTPSMKYYVKENRAYCFSCGRGGDSIDVYTKVHNCDIKTAIKEMTK